MKTVTYQSSQLLSCAKCNGSAVICVDDTLTVGNVPFLEVQILSAEETWDTCGALNYIYGLSYDENALVDPQTELVSGDIDGIFCKGCLTTWIENLADTVWASEAAKVLLPAGIMSMWGGSTAPSGYLMCDGAAVSRATYADLFTNIGTAFGVGDGLTTFNVPNLQKRFPLGLCGDPSISLADTGGNFDHVHAEGTHTHTLQAHTHAGSAHTHDLSNHTHVGVNHTHSVAPHYHSISSGADLRIVASGTHGHVAVAGSFLSDVGVPLLPEDPSGAATLYTQNATANATHVHNTVDFTGRLGLVTGGVNGDAAMVSGLGGNGTSGPSIPNTSGSGSGISGVPVPDATGSSIAMNTGTANPPYVVVNFIIKT